MKKYFCDVCKTETDTLYYPGMQEPDGQWVSIYGLCEACFMDYQAILGQVARAQNHRSQN